MIYSIAEWKLRTKLEEQNETVPDQKGKPTKRPTMRWIFFNFRGITELITQKEEKIDFRVPENSSVLHSCNPAHRSAVDSPGDDSRRPPS